MKAAWVRAQTRARDAWGSGAQRVREPKAVESRSEREEARMRADAAASFSCDERSACPRAFAIEVHRTMSHLPLLEGTQSLWIEISELYRSFDSGGPAVMEPLIEAL